MISVTVSVLILVVSYVTRVIWLFDKSLNYIRTCWLGNAVNCLRRHLTGMNDLTKRHLGWHISYDIILVQVTLFRAFRLIYLSFAWEVLKPYSDFRLYWLTRRKLDPVADIRSAMGHCAFIVCI